MINNLIIVYAYVFIYSFKLAIYIDDSFSLLIVAVGVDCLDITYNN